MSPIRVTSGIDNVLKQPPCPCCGSIRDPAIAKQRNRGKLFSHGNAVEEGIALPAILAN